MPAQLDALCLEKGCSGITGHYRYIIYNDWKYWTSSAEDGVKERWVSAFSRWGLSEMQTCRTARTREKISGYVVCFGSAAIWPNLANISFFIVFIVRGVTDCITGHCRYFPHRTRIKLCIIQEACENSSNHEPWVTTVSRKVVCNDKPSRSSYVHPACQSSSDINYALPFDTHIKTEY